MRPTRYQRMRPAGRGHYCLPTLKRWYGMAFRWCGATSGTTGEPPHLGRARGVGHETLWVGSIGALQAVARLLPTEPAAWSVVAEKEPAHPVAGCSCRPATDDKEQVAAAIGGDYQGEFRHLIRTMLHQGLAIQSLEPEPVSPVRAAAIAFATTSAC